jgi:putative ABC transport system permease protein
VPVLLKIILQSIRLSLEELRASKLRSFLSLTGITIGILCVISVRTAIGSLEQNIKQGFDTFGGDIIYVQKWPILFSNDYPWWRFFNRPMVNTKELAQLQDRLHTAEAAAMVSFNSERAAKYQDKTVEKAALTGATFDYNRIKDMEFTQGRYFTREEADNPTHICILGASIADALFGIDGIADGKEIRVQGVKLRVVGVFKREGDNLIGWTLDNMVYVPYSILNVFINTNGDGEGDPLLAIKPKAGIPEEEVKYEVKGAMRAIRRLSPQEDDNFAINQMSAVTDQISSIFAIISLAGIFIGGFSILVGGFGIANIMFVSVKERTNIIGIKKALGARQSYILMEFLMEAVILCCIGGVMGLGLVVGLTKLANYSAQQSESHFVFFLTTSNVIVGIGISVTIGIIAGFIPAFRASRMRPVDAIRSN